MSTTTATTLFPSTKKQEKETGRIRITRVDTRPQRVGELPNYFSLVELDNGTILIEFQYDKNTTPKISPLMKVT
ncbi:MAG: hypothetical protein FWC33_06065 [Candidatus Bathyarchaeota archaeon]|nr:hypothetical protein [Candidatus Termiticorpusculum sp.]